MVKGGWVEGVLRKGKKCRYVESLLTPLLYSFNVINPLLQRFSWSVYVDLFRLGLEKEIQQVAFKYLFNNSLNTFQYHNQNEFHIDIENVGL